MSDPNVDDAEMSVEEVAEKARTLLCPRCGAKPFMACTKYHGGIQHFHHTERLSAVRGEPTNEKRRVQWVNGLPMHTDRSGGT